MDVRNCKSCGRLFNHMGGQPICSRCLKKLDEKFQEVKSYLEEHPIASVREVSDENDVSVKQIKQWIREERLYFSEPGADGITCEHCGVPIRSGRFCDKCKLAMANSFGGAIKSQPAEEPKKQQRDGNKMRFLQT